MNIENKLVSVVVPVYNVEKYIERCVESLIAQDHALLEIILVDDGTKDNSGKIIDSLAEKDSRIRVIHKTNGGVSSARNAGLEIANGEYVVFVDGDDYVDKDYVSYFLTLAVNNECDIAMNLKNHTYKPADVKQDNQRVISALTAMEYIYTGEIFVAVWNKMYKMSFLRNNGLIFDTDYWYGEGMLFNISCLQFVDKVAVGEKMVYHQVFNPDSAMRKFNLESNHCGMRSMEKQKALWQKSNKEVENAWNYHYRCFYATILYGLVQSGMVKDNLDEYKLCIKKLRSNLSIPLKARIGLKNKIIQIALFMCPVTLARWSAYRTKRIAQQMIINDKRG